MSQNSEEHPHVYLARLKEATILAEISDPIQSITIVNSPSNVRPIIGPSISILNVNRTGPNSSNIVHAPVKFSSINPNSLNVESTTITKLTNSMDALQLNHMESNDVNDSSEPNISRIDDMKFKEKLRIMVDDSIRPHFSKSYNNNNG
ncbi:hypothetical protein INT47_004950 [Mucor saturninus]|uniref:Uncharacterized protein n=1 Tax=Mucor saturninus TaxID=64648 RepID=A0A8H7R4H8_9FUNG|nr:hypothetical protein INT47_004950 [Mucor saturninus]